ncbi:MAG TPA: hypothetical protein PKA39_06335 [Ignavibacteria bacterium]|nr:hypothetical protein [Ignavibacteria bacterium]
MKKSRFAEMLSALDIKDHKRFTELVDSPYFNKNERVKNLWKWIQENPKTGYTKQELMEAAGERLNYANFRLGLSDFVKLVENFLVLESGAIKEAEEEALIEICREKNLSKSYRKYLRITKQRCNETKEKDTAYYNRMYSLECETLINAATDRERKASLERISEHTDHMWMYMKLDNFIKLAALGGDCSKLGFYEEIMKYIEKNKTTLRRQHFFIYELYNDLS